MWRWTVPAVMLLAHVPAADALQITYVTISERITAFQVCAIAGNNGSGPCDAATATGATQDFFEIRSAQARDVYNDNLLPATAGAVGTVSLSAYLDATSLATSGSALVTADVHLAGSARGDAQSEFKTAFYLDADATFGVSGRVECEGDCTAFAALYDPADQPLFDLTTTSGVMTGSNPNLLLRANQSYLMWARTTTVTGRSGAGSDSATGRFSMDLTYLYTGGVPPIPEPGTAAMLILGLAVLFGLGARRRAIGQA